MRNMSLMSNEKECLFCRTTQNLHVHHIYFGSANRKKSDEDGCWCYLCVNHHVGRDGVHTHRSLDLMLKQLCQRQWEQIYGDRAAFIKRYGKSWIMEDTWEE